MKYIYGPISSRRLGVSLGINLTPYKVCPYDCVYCQLGKTTLKTTERAEYLPAGEILEELKMWLHENPEDAKTLQFITFSGSGEPTLNTNIGFLIDQVKKISGVSVAVITNGSLLPDPEVRKTLLAADLLLPSLDAVEQDIFEAIDQPCEGINVEDIINALIDLRKEFHGKIWLEVMLVKGLNDKEEHLLKLKDTVEKINPDKVHFVSPVRLPAGQNADSVSEVKLKKIKKLFGPKAEFFS
ncbi:MAG: radical SAM protein [Candidatus Omnitrophica bacterium]|nr:radical SAM protein [Candidatus Omnitrophota bacterium]